jgi:hypothetical protein
VFVLSSVAQWYKVWVGPSENILLFHQHFSRHPIQTLDTRFSKTSHILLATMLTRSLILLSTVGYSVLAGKATPVKEVSGVSPRQVTECLDPGWIPVCPGSYILLTELYTRLT